MEYVDQRARDLANRAISMIQSHDRACIERAKAAVEWRNATDAKLDSIKKSVSGIYARMWSVAGAFILILLGVIGYLIGKHGI